MKYTVVYHFYMVLAALAASVNGILCAFYAVKKQGDFWGVKFK